MGEDMAKRKLKEAYVKRATYKKYEKSMAILNNPIYVQVKDEFLAKFTLCEIACKSVIDYYKKTQNESADIKEIKLDMRSIPFAFAKFVSSQAHIL